MGGILDQAFATGLKNLLNDVKKYHAWRCEQVLRHGHNTPPSDDTFTMQHFHYMRDNWGMKQDKTRNEADEMQLKHRVDAYSHVCYNLATCGATFALSIFAPIENYIKEHRVFEDWRPNRSTQAKFSSQAVLTRTKWSEALHKEVERQSMFMGMRGGGKSATMAALEDAQAKQAEQDHAQDALRYGMGISQENKQLNRMLGGRKR